MPKYDRQGADPFVDTAYTDDDGLPFMPPDGSDPIIVTDFDQTQDNLQIDFFGFPIEDFSFNPTQDDSGVEIWTNGVLRAMLQGVNVDTFDPNSVEAFNYAI
ncbi:MAG: hypothetical protein DI533_12610 [Cereibacter sphaeroides]|uniref:Uncharacterized protein n=1 Tax=Cereibacter sphaeroides TaxID=1063 RepID=A0A2W5TQ86_CERSP|nr:MAG: hypothetical protein DI533_12610 [Cereibacter sphaeroides]